jgi:PleD family two-component response regulator
VPAGSTRLLPAPTTKGDGVRALIIDDACAMRSILKRIVLPLGFEVHEAGNGREALDHLLATDEVPDLALVDWNMPEMPEAIIEKLVLLGLVPSEAVAAAA